MTPTSLAIISLCNIPGGKELPDEKVLDASHLGGKSRILVSLGCSRRNALFLAVKVFVKTHSNNILKSAVIPVLG